MNHKPVFHITGERGWINDPNGLVKFKGRYHIFFQHHPYGTEWGPMHWGHVVSDDLLHFEYLPYALVPGDSFDKDGCFSGSSLVKDGKLYVAYTGFIDNKNPDDIRQIQCLASSEDGIHFKKHGVIIDETLLPKEFKPCDFRDPKLYFKDGYYYILVMAKKVVGNGSILLFKSLDLQKWEFVSDVLTHDSEGTMLECADYQSDLELLLYSEQNFPADNEHCLNIHSCEYEIGTFNKDHKFIAKGEKRLVDYGFDFYAPQVLEDGHYLIAWMDMWDRNNPTAKYGFAGMLTVPRKITVKDGILLQKPVIFGDLCEKIDIKNTYTGRMSVGTIELQIEDLKSLSIDLRKGENEVTKFYLKDGEFFFDRSHSGEAIVGAEKDPLSLAGIRKMPYTKKDKDEIFIVMDKYSIEIFVNGISMTNTVYPKKDSDGLEIALNAGQANLSLYK